MSTPPTRHLPHRGRAVRRVALAASGLVFVAVAALPAGAGTPAIPVTTPPTTVPASTTTTAPTTTVPATTVPVAATTTTTIIPVPPATTTIPGTPPPKIVVAPIPPGPGDTGSGSSVPPYDVKPVADLVAPPLTPGLDQVKVTSPAFDAANAKVTQVQGELATAIRDKVADGQSLVRLHRRDATLSAKLATAEGQRRVASHRLGILRTAIEQMAVASYVGGGSSNGDASGLDLDVSADAQIGKKQVMVGIVNSAKLTRLQLDQQALDKARTEITITSAVQTGVRKSIRSTTARRNSAANAQVQFGEQLLTTIAGADDSRRLATVVGLDFPLVVLDAYVKAANTMAVTEPSCGITWWALAGIGRTESHQGTFGGATVRIDGSLSQPILGIPLDGSDNTAVITGANGPDRAQGPMQFITSTWAKWGRDGNGDGVIDIQNFYDSAAAAAAYLCAGGPMNSVAGLERGYFSYNQSLTYVAQVLGEAEGYGDALRLPLASLASPARSLPPQTS